jgi:glutathione S-transferase
MPDVTSPADVTGFKAEQRARATTKAKREAAEQQEAELRAEKARLEMDVHDPSSQRPALVLDDIEEVGVRLADDAVIIRTIADIEGMSFGVGSLYTFRAGQKYKVSRALADWLEYQGYIWRPS